ncbi:MAG: GntR family transcriptional regulator [Pirellulales bacterium]
MLIYVDHGNGLPVYDQIARQVKFAVADGVLSPDELIPSVRELARELAINPNTVARAYRHLQDDGVIDAVRGTGLVVSRDAAKRCRQERTRLIRERLGQTLGEAMQSGLSRDDVLKLVHQELDAIERLRTSRRKSR